MTDFLKTKWKQASANVRLLVLVAGTSLLGFTGLYAVAQFVDNDQDGIADDFETFFGMDPNDPNDAFIDFDFDQLINFSEFQISTDPFSPDTDGDGLSDLGDLNPISRAHYDLGQAHFVNGNQFDYVTPPWALGVVQEGGLWKTNAPTAWHVPKEFPKHLGRLFFEIDAAQIPGDLVVSLTLFDYKKSSRKLFLELTDQHGDTLFSVLLKDDLIKSEEVATIRKSLPISTHPNARFVVLRRDKDTPVTLFLAQLYLDADEDGLDDDQEIQLGTDPGNADTDADGTSDGEEFLADRDPTDPRDGTVDADEDDLPDGWELFHFGTLDHSGSCTGDDWSQDMASIRSGDSGGCSDDPDGDGLVNLGERLLGTNPNNPDTDADGLPDGWEVAHDLDPLDPAGEHGPQGDPDGDGIDNWDEFQIGSDPNGEDSDGDRLPDGFERDIVQFDPNDDMHTDDDVDPKDDFDGDGVNNRDEQEAGTDPTDPNSKPVQIRGNVVNTTGQKGEIVVIASADPASWAGYPMTRIKKVGKYTIKDVPSGYNYYVKAWVDLNKNGVPDLNEPRGRYATNPLLVPADMNSIHIIITPDQTPPVFVNPPANLVVASNAVPGAVDPAVEDDSEVTLTLTETLVPLVDDFQLYVGTASDGLNGNHTTGFSKGLVSSGGKALEDFSDLPTGAANGITGRLENIYFTIHLREDNGTLLGDELDFEIEDPVERNGAFGVGAGLDENAGAAGTRNQLRFVFEKPIAHFGLDLIDVAAGVEIQAYDESLDSVYSNRVGETGSGAVRFIGLASDAPRFRIVTITAASGTDHLAVDNLRFGLSTLAPQTLTRTWTATDVHGNASQFTQDLALLSADQLPEPKVEHPPNLWINEIHYDNLGADVNEGVEIAGEAGTDLGNYTLYFYDGTSGLVYHTYPLSGLIPNETNGFGTVWFAIPGIQNGASPDGVALVENETDDVIECLSYEGEFLVANGPAAGLTSEDIDVAEDAFTDPDTSLQNQTANAQNDGAWTGDLLASPGDLNENQFPLPPLEPLSSSDDFRIVDFQYLFNTVVLAGQAPTSFVGQAEIFALSLNSGDVYPGRATGWASEVSLSFENATDYPQPDPKFTHVAGAAYSTSNTVASAFDARLYTFGNADLDSDGDGTTDAREFLITRTDANDPDPDGDGLLNIIERSAGTDMNNPDTDGDNVSDYDELLAGTDPLDENSFPPPLGLIVYTPLEK